MREKRQTLGPGGLGEPELPSGGLCRRAQLCIVAGAALIWGLSAAQPSPILAKAPGRRQQATAEEVGGRASVEGDREESRGKGWARWKDVKKDIRNEGGEVLQAGGKTPE